MDLLIRGVVAIIFGVLVFISGPLVTAVTLVLVFGAYALVDGGFAIFHAIQHRDQPSWWATLIEGIIGVLVGLGALLLPPPDTLSILFYVIAFWAIATGAMEVITAIQVRKEVHSEIWMILSGLASLAFGVLLIVFPLAGLLTLWWLIGVYAVAFGVMMILLAFRARGMGGTSATRSAA